MFLLPFFFLLFLLFFIIFWGKLTVFKKNYFNFVDPHFLSFVHDDVGGVHKFATRKRWKAKQITWKFVFETKNTENWLREISMSPFKMLNGRVNVHGNANAMQYYLPIDHLWQLIFGISWHDYVKWWLNAIFEPIEIINQSHESSETFSFEHIEIHFFQSNISFIGSAPKGWANFNPNNCFIKRNEIIQNCFVSINLQ